MSNLLQRINERFPGIDPVKVMDRVIRNQASLDERAIYSSICGLSLNDWKPFRPKYFEKLGAMKAANIKKK